ncbi:MAG: CHASE2 domain-containing protein [Moraxellaceae bacterium]|nr:CHASE2 domain-containing protein [Pseudobdellovibrionaceae bacterium]
MSLLLKFFFAAVASTVISSLKLDYIESFFYDQRVQIKSALKLSTPQNPKSIMVLIDHDTVVKYKGFPSYIDHTHFLERLQALQPKFILYDFRSKDNELVDIEGNFADRIIFSEAVGKISHFYILTDELEMKGEAGKLQLNTPLEYINRLPAPKTSDTILFAKDGITRRFMISYQDTVLLHPQVAGWYNKSIRDLSNIRGQFELYDSIQGYTQYSAPGTYPVYRFDDIIEGRVPAEIFKDKIVIVGTDTGKSAKEYVATPFSSEVTAMRSTEYHANVIQTLIDNNAVVRWPRWMNIILTCLISFLTVYTVFALRPGRGLIVLMLTLVGLATAVIFAFVAFNIWIDLAHPFLAIFICYYFFIPYRLIKENRLTWEYYQRNKLLKQVEELKTNFISMMSHDLKTPIARIQGMTEVITSDDQKLSVSQHEALDNIKTSSDDLLKFINSILQYGRIESQGLELNLQSKDVNKLLSEVIKKHEFLAKVKKIKLNSNLEPLFPINVDPDLIKQVFSNLLENAIKYSREESTIYISSREADNNVYIDFKDEGVGIPTADLPNIFMKFFRSHDVKISTIKGSGLGLYLASYFAELHQGTITVTSQAGVGSCFTVKLPIN